MMVRYRFATTKNLSQSGRGEHAKPLQSEKVMDKWTAFIGKTNELLKSRFSSSTRRKKANQVLKRLAKSLGTIGNHS